MFEYTGSQKSIGELAATSPELIPSSLRTLEIERLEAEQRRYGTGMNPEHLARLEQLQSLQAGGYEPARPAAVTPHEVAVSAGMAETARREAEVRELSVYKERKRAITTGEIVRAGRVQVPLRGPAAAYPYETETYAQRGRVYISAEKKGQVVVHEAPKGVTAIKVGAVDYRPFTLYEKAEQTLQPISRKLILEKPEWEEPFSEKKLKSILETYEKGEAIGGVRGFTLRKLASFQVGAEKLGQLLYYQEKGQRYALRETPIKASAYLAVGFAAPKVLAVAGKAGWTVAGLTRLTKIPGFEKGVGVATKGVAVSIGGLYAYSVGKRVAVQPTSKMKAFELGKIEAGEVLPLVVGGVAGAKFWPKFEGYFRTLGRKEISVERLVAREVLAGEKRFPLAGEKLTAAQRQKLHYKIFKKGEYIPPELKGYYPHAAPEAWKSLEVMKGTSELPGAYISGKGLSVHFLKVGTREYSLLGYDLPGGYGKPVAMYIKPVKLAKLPAVKVPKGWMFTGPVKKGVAYIPGMKPEVEAIITTGTQLTKVRGEYFFKYGGTKIPIDLHKAISGAKVLPSAGSIERLVSSAYMPKISPLLTPSRIIAPTISGLYSVKGKAVKAPSYSKMMRLVTSMTYPDPSRKLPSRVVPSRVPKSYAAVSYKFPSSISRAISTPSKKLISPPSLSKLSKASAKSIARITSRSTRQLSRITPTVSYISSFGNIERAMSSMRRGVIGYPGEKKKKRKVRKGRRKEEEEIFYSPDLLAKVLGQTTKVNKKLAKQLLTMKFTGFELRPGLKGGMKI